MPLTLGARPGEICELKPVDVDQEGDVWLFRPASYKTEHLHETQGERVLFVGPKAQHILSPYLERDADAFCFQPKESEEQRRRTRHEKRTTPLEHGNRPGTNRSRSPKRPAGDYYTTDSYRRAIHRACDFAFPAPAPLGKRERESKKAWVARLTQDQLAELRTWQASHRWSPNQIRHSAATKLRSEFGAEAARVMLGHNNLSTTEIYAERDLKLGVEIAKTLG